MQKFDRFLRSRVSYGMRLFLCCEVIMAKCDIPLWERTNLTLEEYAAYSGIGINKLRDLTNNEDCKFVLWIGNKRLIKRKLCDKYIEEQYSI